MSSLIVSTALSTAPRSTHLSTANATILLNGPNDATNGRPCTAFTARKLGLADDHSRWPLKSFTTSLSSATLRAHKRRVHKHRQQRIAINHALPRGPRQEVPRVRQRHDNTIRRDGRAGAQVRERQVHGAEERVFEVTPGAEGEALSVLALEADEEAGEKG
ncbi:hypothetical protein KEM55_007165 [Ascosphaera atra]|nr:hypothetical protein KEM55_007165 [Ascosphaera atra]